MTTNILPPHIQAQLARLSNADAKRLAATIEELSRVVEAAHQVSTGEVPFETWPKTWRGLNALLAQMGSFVEVPPVLYSIVQEGPDGAGRGMHCLPAELLRSHVKERDNLAREALACFNREIEEQEDDLVTYDPEQYVTLDQAAAWVNRAKKTLERRVNKEGSDAPLPEVEGGSGRAHEWRWSVLRPWLEKTYGKKLPGRLPSRGRRG
jgi:hypothetical protein